MKLLDFGGGEVEQLQSARGDRIAGRLQFGFVDRRFENGLGCDLPKPGPLQQRIDGLHRKKTHVRGVEQAAVLVLLVPLGGRRKQLDVPYIGNRQ